MSFITLFNENTANINNGDKILSRIYEHYKIEDIPSSVMPNFQKLTQYWVRCENQIELSDSKFLHVDGDDLEVDQIFDMTFKSTQITYLVITKRC